MGRAPKESSDSLIITIYCLFMPVTIGLIMHSDDGHSVIKFYSSIIAVTVGMSLLAYTIHKLLKLRKLIDNNYKLNNNLIYYYLSLRTRYLYACIFSTFVIGTGFTIALFEVPAPLPEVITATEGDGEPSGINTNPPEVNPPKVDSELFTPVEHAEDSHELGLRSLAVDYGSESTALSVEVINRSATLISVRRMDWILSSELPKEADCQFCIADARLYQLDSNILSLDDPKSTLHIINGPGVGHIKTSSFHIERKGKIQYKLSFDANFTLLPNGQEVISVTIPKHFNIGAFSSLKNSNGGIVEEDKGQVMSKAYLEKFQNPQTKKLQVCLWEQATYQVEAQSANGRVKARTKIKLDPNSELIC